MENRQGFQIHITNHHQQTSLLMIKKCFMLVKHHGCYEMVVLSLDNSYCHMAK